MNTNELLAAVLSSDELPSLPAVASRLIDMTADEGGTLTEIADLLSKDPALSAKILRVANSALYGFPQKIGSIHQAASVLGTNAVRSLALSFSFLSIGKGNQPSFDFKAFWGRSLAAAVIAKILLEEAPGSEGDNDSDEVFISGLLHNLGVLILAMTFPKDYDQVLTTNQNLGDPREAEQTIFGEDHCFVGYEVASHWNLPPRLLSPILHHHSPKDFKGDDPVEKRAIKAVYLADILLNIFHSSTPDTFHKRFTSEAKKLLGLSASQIEELLATVHTKVEQAGQSFNLKVEGTRPIQEILQEANIRLSLSNLNYEQINKKLVEAQISLENLTRELQETNSQLDVLANTDGLTAVYNSRYFHKTLDQEISRAKRNNTPLSLLLADIDNFKHFNDVHGHQAGNFVLVEFCKVMSGSLREYDTLARFGGEEFIVVLPETTEADACAVAEKLRINIEQFSFEDNGQSFHVTASFGVCGSSPATAEGFDKHNFIDNADKALYQAKNKGRNRIATFCEKKKSWYNF